MELLGGAGLDPSNMFPLADLCHSFHGSGKRVCTIFHKYSIDINIKST